MTKDKYDRMINQFSTYYRDLYNQTVDWWPSGRSCVTVKLEDGMLFEYSVLDNTIRRVRPDDYAKDAETIRREVGHNLQKAIHSRGLSQSEIAQKVGITEAMLSRYIHGTSMPGLDKVYSLASVLGCRIVDILGENYN